MLARVVPISKMTILWNSLVISDWWSRFLKIPLASISAFLQFHLLAILLFGTPAFLLVIPLIYDLSYRQSHFTLFVTCQSIKSLFLEIQPTLANISCIGIRVGDTRSANLKHCGIWETIHSNGLFYFGASSSGWYYGLCRYCRLTSGSFLAYDTAPASTLLLLQRP